MSSGPIAVVDIGSNSIKLLVATRRPDGVLESVKMRTIDARISAGISQAQPRLGEEGMARGLAAVSELLATASRFGPTQTVLVATSAVRDAENGLEFRARVHGATGQHVRILTGDEEADLIGRGLTCDPALAQLQDFYVFDLGGGSLECLAFHGRRVAQARSLRLGCVRLTERFVPDINAPFSKESCAAVMAHTRDTIEQSGFRFDVPGTRAVFAGGSMTTVRTVFGARTGQTLDQTSSLVGVAELRALLATLAPMTLEQRKQVPGLPAARADVFPTAIATMIAVAECGQLPAFQHSLYNLRWGLADEALKG